MNNIEVVVAGIIFNSENKILLCKSSKWNNKYVIPGGHVEFGETLEEALIREVLEETQLRIFDVELVGAKNAVFSKENGEKRHLVLFDFTCKTKDSNVVLNEEAEEYNWLCVNEIHKYPLDNFTRDFLVELQRNNTDKKKTIIYNL